MSNLKEKNGTFNTLEYNFPQPKQSVPFKHLIFNPSDGTIFGRTPSSWSKIIIFYVIFYIVLAGLFAVCMQGLLATLTEDEPHWKLEKSLIGTNPGLGFRPLSDETERGSIIQFNSTQRDTWLYWKELLDEFLEPYFDRTKVPNGGTNQKHCDFNTTKKPDEVCLVQEEIFKNCVSANNYGYANSAPCIFLKLNKIYDWVPDYYSNEKDLPDDMPQDLQDYIGNEKNFQNNAERQQIWVSCKGQRDNDQELLANTTITYFPTSRGFPAYYYPYKNIPGYLSPLIAVQFSKLKKHELVNIECRAWARNIIYSGSIRDRKGSVSFQLLVD